ncbi:MAG TPA: hypothetical protein VFB79_04020, partial [Candidatus Angelobacter sp.]|nr:hypothetical protein [Candidatus Angelobacter sp.]
MRYAKFLLSIAGFGLLVACSSGSRFLRSGADSANSSVPSGTNAVVQVMYKPAALDGGTSPETTVVPHSDKLIALTFDDGPR